MKERFSFKQACVHCGGTNGKCDCNLPCLCGKVKARCICDKLKEKHRREQALKEWELSRSEWG